MDSTKQNSEKSNLSINELRRLSQSSGPSEETQSFTGRSARFFSVYFTRYFIGTKITPNQITFFGTCLYLFGCSLYAFGNYSLSIFAFGLLYLSTILDASDGEVFRFRGYKSRYGGLYVEPLSHDIMYGLMFLPISYGVYLTTGNFAYFILGALASIFKLLFRLTEQRFYFGVTRLLPAGGQIDDTKKFKEQSDSSQFIYRVYRNTFTSTGILMPLFLATVFNLLNYFLIIYAFGFIVLWLSLLARQIKRFSKISQQVIDRRNYFFEVKSRIKDKKIIVFDLDGTVLDTMSIFADIASYLIAWRYEISRPKAREMYINTSGLPFFKQLEVMFPGHQFNKEVSDLYEERKVHATDHLEINPQDKIALQKLIDNGYKIAVSSNNFQENVDRFVKFSGLNFSYALGYSNGFDKGEKHFNYIKEKEGIKEREMIFVADSIYDLKKSLSCKIDFIGKIGTFSKESFEKEWSNTITINRLEELNDIL